MTRRMAGAAVWTLAAWFGLTAAWAGAWWGVVGALLLAGCALRAAVLLREWRHDDEVAARWPRLSDTIRVELVDERYTPGPSESHLPERPIREARMTTAHVEPVQLVCRAPLAITRPAPPRVLRVLSEPVRITYQQAHRG